MMTEPYPHHWTIYLLSDSTTGEVRYVGKTINPEKRLREHIRRARTKSENVRRTHNDNWINALLSVGVEPSLVCLETGEGIDTWQEAEKRWIAYYREQGCDLVNIKEGGNGSSDRRTSEETRALISEKLRGRPVSEETRRRISEANKGKKRTPEVVEAQAAVLRGRKRDPDAVARTADKVRGQKRTEEQRQRMSVAQRGKRMPPHSPERRAELAALLQSEEVQAKRREAVATEQWRQRQSESHKGKKVPADVVEKTAAKLRGVPKSEETRRRMSEGQAARHARLRADREVLTSEV